MLPDRVFNHVQIHLHWMHLLNTRLCRYTCIYVTGSGNLGLMEVHGRNLDFNII